MFKYKVNLGSELIDLDNIMTVLKGDKCSSLGEGLRKEMYYEFGQAGYQFIVDTLQEQVNNIKARQPSAE